MPLAKVAKLISIVTELSKHNSGSLRRTQLFNKKIDWRENPAETKWTNFTFDKLIEKSYNLLDRIMGEGKKSSCSSGFTKNLN